MINRRGDLQWLWTSKFQISNFEISNPGFALIRVPKASAQHESQITIHDLCTRIAFGGERHGSATSGGRQGGDMSPRDNFCCTKEGRASILGFFLAFFS